MRVAMRQVSKSPPDSQSRLLEGAVAEVIEKASLERKLKLGRPLKVKLGIDPTSPELHLGHAVVLSKLREFQDLGHQAILVIGDFTALIGDPTERNSIRPPLSPDEIEDNLRSYTETAGKIIDLTKARVVRNSQWLNRMNLRELLGYAAQVSLSGLIEREDFRSRMESGGTVSLHEALYALIQAIDSVSLEADVELGAIDQKLNCLIGRELQRKLGLPVQDLLLTKLLIGLDGQKKMSKSLGNYISLTSSPNEMFGKIMSLPDSLIGDYACLAAWLTEEEVNSLPTLPRQAKAVVAKKIVRRFHGLEAAERADEVFEATFKQKKVSPELIQDVELTGSPTLLEAISQIGAMSRSRASRLIAQRGVKVDDKTVDEPHFPLQLDSRSVILQLGKHRFFRLRRR